MKAEEYKKELLKGIDKEIKKCPELDPGKMWWKEFRKWVKAFDPEPKEDPIDFAQLLVVINRTFGREFRVISSAIKSKYRARLRDGYTKEDIMRAIINCSKSDFHSGNNYRYCTPTFFSQETTLEKWGTRKVEEETTNDSPVN